MSIFFSRTEGKKVAPAFTLCVKGRAKLSKEILGRESSRFLLPPTFPLHFPVPPPLLGGSQNAVEIWAQDLFCSEVWIGTLVGGCDFT